MSSLIVEVCKIDKIEKHPESDKLKVVYIKGWQVITASTDLKEGDKVVYIPPDSVLTQELAEKWKVTPYLKHLAKDQFGNFPPGGRVGVAKLRGCLSFGFVVSPDDPSWEIGKDVAEFYGITKWEPPPELINTDAAPDVFMFHKYTDIENFRNFPDVLKDGEEVVITEKCHGKNLRLGLIRSEDQPDSPSFVFMVATHNQRLKEFTEEGRRSHLWSHITENVKSLLQELCANKNSVILFTELIGSKISDLPYGMSKGKVACLAFDISINSAYLNYDEKINILTKHNVPMCPILYRGPFSKEILDKYTTGDTTVCDPKLAGHFRGREGIVITPTKERWDMRIGRVILKSINPDYSTRKGGKDCH